MIVDELITLLKFDTEGMSNAEAFNAVLSKIEEHSKAIVIGLTGAIASVGYFADRVSKSVAENYEWAKSVGVASDSYQRFEHAAEVVGGSLDDIKGDLEGWVRSAKASGQTLEEVFLRETDSIKGMSHEQAYALLKARGYSDTSIKLIQQGEGELKKFLNQAEVIPEENLKAAEDYAKTWREVTSQVNQLMTVAVASALPALKGVLNTIRDFVQRNKELVKGTVSTFFKSVALALKIVFAALTPLIRGIEFLIKVFDVLTFGAGKHIIIVGLLTAAFTAMAIAAGIKAVKGIASLMGNLSSMINIAGKAIGYMAEMTLEIAANGVKQTFLNSTLVTGVKLWWLEFKARVANLGVQIKNLIYAGKELISMTIGNTKLGIRIGLWYLDMKARIANMMVTIKATIREWAHTAAVTAQTIAMKLHIASLKSAAIAMGTYILSLLKGIAAGIKFAVTMTIKMIPALISGTGAILKFAFTMTGSLVKSLIAAVPAIITFAGTFFAAVIPALIAATSAVWAFTAALLANPLTWIVVAIVAAIVAIGAAVYAVIKYWDQIVDAVMACVNWVADLFSWMKNGNSIAAKLAKWFVIMLAPVTLLYFYWDEIVDAIKGCIDWVVNLFSWMKKGDSTLAKILKYVTMFLSPLTAIYFYWDEIVAAIQWCWDKLKAFFSWWWSSYKAFWTGAWNAIVGFVQKAWNYITGIFTSIKDWFLSLGDETVDGLLSRFWNFLKSIPGSIVNMLKSIVDIVKNAVTGVLKWVWNLLPSGLQNFLSSSWSKVTGFFGKILSSVKFVFGKVKLFFTDTISKVISTIKALPGKIISGVKNLFSRIWGMLPAGLQNFLKTAWSKATEWVTKGLNFVKTTFSKIVGFFGSIFSKIWSAVKGLVSKLWNFLPSGLQNFLSSSWNKTVGFFGKIKTWTANLFNSIANLFSKPTEEIWSVVTGLFEQIMDSIKSVGKTVWDVVVDAILSAVNYVLGVISNAVNSAIDLLNKVIRFFNKIPFVNIPEIGHVDLKIKKEKPEEESKSKESKKEKPEEESKSTMAPSEGKQEPVLSPAPVIQPDIEVMAPSEGKQEPVIQPETPPVIIEQATMSQEQPRQELARDSVLPPDTREKQDAVFEETGAVRSFNPANVPSVDVAAERAKVEQAFLDVLQSAAPVNTVPVGQAAVATATPGQVTNNNQRSSSYVDQRNITINTNATSGPAIAAYMRGTNDMMSAGVGMAGAF